MSNFERDAYPVKVENLQYFINKWLLNPLTFSIALVALENALLGQLLKLSFVGDRIGIRTTHLGEVFFPFAVGPLRKDNAVAYKLKNLSTRRRESHFGIWGVPLVQSRMPCK